MNVGPGDFDALALFAALDAQRVERGLSWQGVARQLWEQTAVLNAERQDHPISPATLTGMAKRRDTTCQHALFMLRWLGEVPEDFVPGAETGPATALPPVGPDQRLRWNLVALYEAIDLQRKSRGLTWAEAAKELRCGASQLTGLRTARYATSMVLAMRITRWLERPAADFVYPARW